MPSKSNEFPVGFKQLQTLEGHTQNINRLAWSPDGKRIASTSQDHTIRTWDLDTGKESWTVETENRTYGVTWSPDGSKLFGSANDGLLAWKSGVSESEWSFDPPNGTIGDLAYSPQSHLIAAGCSDRMVRIVDVQELPHTKAVPTVDWSPSSDFVVSGVFGGEIVVWDSTSWKVKSRLEGHSSDIWGIAWSPSGDILASASADHTVGLWDAKNEDKLQLSRDTLHRSERSLFIRWSITRF
jgi:WD40 repeat protein